MMSLDLNVGCGTPVSLSGLVPRTPLSPSKYAPCPQEYNLDTSMFVAGVRRSYQEEFHQSVADTMQVYSNQVVRLEATWSSSSTAGSSAAMPVVVSDDLLR